MEAVVGGLEVDDNGEALISERDSARFRKVLCWKRWLVNMTALDVEDSKVNISDSRLEPLETEPPVMFLLVCDWLYSFLSCRRRRPASSLSHLSDV